MKTLLRCYDAIEYYHGHSRQRSCEYRSVYRYCEENKAMHLIYGFGFGDVTEEGSGTWFLDQSSSSWTKQFYTGV